MMCQFRLTATSPICGQATHGEFCPYHQGVVGRVATKAYEDAERRLRADEWLQYEQVCKMLPEHQIIEATVHERKPRRWLPWVILLGMLVFSFWITLVFLAMFLFFAFVVMARNGQGRPVEHFQPSERVVIPDLDQYREAS